MRSIITLTTDFGISSPYVAQMKGVILSICRDVELIDISHAIGPQNIREAAVVLADATPRFPPEPFTSPSSIRASALRGELSMPKSASSATSRPTTAC